MSAHYKHLNGCENIDVIPTIIGCIFKVSVDTVEIVVLEKIGDFGRFPLKPFIRWQR